VHPRTRRRQPCRRGHDTRPHGEAEGPRSAGPGAVCASVRKWPGASSMSSAVVTGSGTYRTRPSGSTMLACPHSFLLLRQPQPPLSRFSWAKTYPVVGLLWPISIWSSIRFIHICFFTDTPCIHILGVSDTYLYPYRIRIRI
jgi:hypothetical protein